MIFFLEGGGASTVEKLVFAQFQVFFRIDVHEQGPRSPSFRVRVAVVLQLAN